MGYAEDKLYDYIKGKLSTFARNMRVEHLLTYLPCLTQADQEHILREVDRKGDFLTSWFLLDTLRRRQGWVNQLIKALEEEHSELAVDLRRRYEELQNSATSGSQATYSQQDLVSPPVSTSNSNSFVSSAHHQPVSPPPPPFVGSPTSATSNPNSSLPLTHSQPSVSQTPAACSPPPSYSSLQHTSPASSLPPSIYNNTPGNSAHPESLGLDENNSSNSDAVPSASNPIGSPVTLPMNSQLPKNTLTVNSSVLSNPTVSNSHSVVFPPSHPPVTSNCTQTSHVAGTFVPNPSSKTVDQFSRLSASVPPSMSTSGGASCVGEDSNTNSCLKPPVQESSVLNHDRAFPKQRGCETTEAEKVKIGVQPRASQQNKAPDEQGEQRAAYRTPAAARRIQTGAISTSASGQIHRTQPGSIPINESLYGGFSKPGILRSASVEPSPVNHQPADQTRPGYSGCTSNLQVSSGTSESSLERDLASDPILISKSISSGTSEISRNRIGNVPEEVHYASDESVSGSAVGNADGEVGSAKGSIVEQKIQALQGYQNIHVLDNPVDIANPYLLQEQFDVFVKYTNMANVSESEESTQANILNYLRSNLREYGSQLTVAENNSRSGVINGSALEMTSTVQVSSMSDSSQSRELNQMPVEDSDVKAHTVRISEDAEAPLEAGNERAVGMDEFRHLDGSSSAVRSDQSGATSYSNPVDHPSRQHAPTLPSQSQDHADRRGNGEASLQPTRIQILSIVVALVSVSTLLLWRYMRK